MGQLALERGVRVGEYLIETLIARGGMGAVYQALHPVIGKKAAVKVMNPSLSAAGGIERFIQEARAVNQIHHPNIVDVFSFGRLDDGRAYMVMELIEGEVLADALRAGPLPIADVAAILRQLASAVAAAHDKGVVHRDLKPDNIMLVTHHDGRRQVKLLDFGIAKLANPDDHAFMGKTQTGLVLGTPFYMSPEQARGKGVDHRTDIYALGCITFEMLTGRVPYPSDNSTDAVIQHCQAPIPSTGAERAEVPFALDDLIRRMLAKTSDIRPTLAEIIEELDQIVATLEDRSAFATTFLQRGKDPTPIPHLITPQPSAPQAVAVDTVADSPRSHGLVWLTLVVIIGLSAAGVALLAGGGGSDGDPQPAAMAAGDDDPRQQRKPSLVVEVDVAEADVYIDGEHRGTAQPRLAVPGIKPGKHRLEVRAKGRITQVQSVLIADGETLRTLISLPEESGTTVPSDAGVAVADAAAEPPSQASKRQSQRDGGRSSARSGPGRSEKSGSSRGRRSNRVRKAGSRDRDYTIDPFAN
ncbi:MAG: protein kinase [Deltaproteobacteria bacterium]|nr:protein kinase [Deltaproteobacteria bacterium]